MSFIGIDVGTTNIKAASFSEKGAMLAYHAESTPIVHPSPGASEFEPEAIWRQICTCVRAVARETGADIPRSVGVSAMAEGGLLLDAQGRPLSNIVAWYDMRAVPQNKQLEQALGRQRIYTVTGQPSSAKYGVTKLMWLCQNRSGLVERASHWLSVADYALYRLSGEAVTDYSVASRTMAFDIHALAWSDEIIQAAGVPKRLFPKVYPGGVRIGGITQQAAEACGLPVGTPVCTGGHDHACAAIAVDILEDGVCMDSMGTAEVSMMALERAALSGESLASGYSVYPHCGGKLYRVLTSNQCCGVCLEWAIRAFGGLAASENGASRYDRFLDTMSDADSVLFFPFLRGTAACVDAKGVFWGVDEHSTSRQFVSAMIDGLCFELKRQIEGYDSLFGIHAGTLRVVGGLSKSGPIMQRKSRIQQCAVSVPGNTEAACRGAAVLGALGAGELSWSQTHFVPGREYAQQPVPKDMERYRRYLALRPDIFSLYERSSD